MLAVEYRLHSAPGNHVQQAAIHTLLAPAGGTQLEVKQEGM